MDTHEKMDEQLWAYIDGLAGPDEQSRISTLIEENNAWREKYAELLDIHQLLQSSALEEPSMRFTRNVMEEVSKLKITPATRNYINKNIIRGLAIFFLTLITGMLVYGFSQMDFSGTDSYSFSSQLEKVDYSKFFSSELLNGFMMLNVLLGLVLLDMYFNNKRKAFRKENQ